MGKTIRGAPVRQRSGDAPAARNGPKLAYTAEGGGHPRPLPGSLLSSPASWRVIPRENDSWPATPRKGTLANATVTTRCLCFILLASWLLPRYRAIAGHDATANRRLSSPQQLETCMPPHGWRLSVVIVTQASQVVNSAGLAQSALEREAKEPGRSRWWKRPCGDPFLARGARGPTTSLPRRAAGACRKPPSPAPSAGSRAGSRSSTRSRGRCPWARAARTCGPGSSC